MPAQTSDLERLLERVLGFQRVETHHHYFKLIVNGVSIAVTRTSHGSKFQTISDGLLAKIAREDLHVSPRLLKELLAGTKGRDDYYAELRRQGRLPDAGAS